MKTLCIGLILVAAITLTSCERGTIIVRVSGDESYAVIKVSHMHEYMDIYDVDEQETSIVINAKVLKRDQIIDLGTVTVPMPKGYEIIKIDPVTRETIKGKITTDRFYIHVKKT